MRRVACPLKLSPLASASRGACTAAQVTLRTLNTAQSAFVVFKLSSTFFAEYLVHSSAATSVKLYLKNVVSIFRRDFAVCDCGHLSE